MKFQYAVFRKRLTAHRAPAGWVTSFDIIYSELTPFDTDKEATDFIAANSKNLDDDEFFIKQEIYSRGKDD